MSNKNIVFQKGVKDFKQEYCRCWLKTRSNLKLNTSLAEERLHRTALSHPDSVIFMIDGAVWNLCKRVYSSLKI